MLSRRAPVPIATALLATLAACGPRTVALDPKRVTAVRIVAPGGASLCANDDATPLRAVVHYRDGTILATRGYPGAKPDAWIRPDELWWAASLGVVDPSGTLIPPADRLTWLGQPIEVRVAIARDPSRSASVTLAPRYDCGVVAAAGAPGPGGDTGGDGGAGAPGARVHVALAYLDLPATSPRPGGAPPAPRRWVLARVHVEGAPGVRYHVIDPAGPGRFTIDARGGDGGDGGGGASGPDGASGSDGADGTDSYTCSNGGDGGNGGHGSDGGAGGAGGRGGDGGDGGLISVEYDARFPELARTINYDINGGGPGAGGEGGSGGNGGAGGRGGKGGSAGTSSGGKPCYASDGSDGRDGGSGSDGPRGSGGAAGRPGRPGELRARAADVATLFGDELARAMPIAPVDAGAPRAPSAP